MNYVDQKVLNSWDVENVVAIDFIQVIPGSMLISR